MRVGFGFLLESASNRLLSDPNHRKGFKKPGLKVSELTEPPHLKHYQGRQMDCARVHHINH